MPQQQQSNIDAIAAKYGATVSDADVDAIAKKYGATVSSADSGDDLTWLQKAALAYSPGSAVPFAVASAAPSVARGIVRNLPAVGGMVGGAMGGVPGAAVGGAVGEGYRSLIQNAPEIPGAIKDVATNLTQHPMATLRGANQGINYGGEATGVEAGTQALGQAAGDTLAQGASAVSKWLMNRATTRVTAKLMQEFPELSDTLIANGLEVSKGGYAQARAYLQAYKAQAEAAVTKATAQGKKIPIALTPDLADSFKQAILRDAIQSGRISGYASKTGAGKTQPLTIVSERLDPATQRMFNRIDYNAAAGTPLDITPKEADLLKSRLQLESKPWYLNRNPPNGPRAMAMSADEKAEYARRLNELIDDHAPGYMEANEKAQQMIGARRGINQAIRPGGNLLQAMVRPALGAMAGANAGGAAGYKEGGGLGAAMGASMGAVTGAALTSPVGMSREAILLAHPAIQGAIRALPKPLAQWLLESLTPQQGGGEQ